MNSRHSPGLWIEQVGNTCVGQVGICNDQRVTGKALGIGSLEQDRSGLALRQEFAVLRVGQEAQLSRASLVQGRKASDVELRRATEGGPEELGQLAEFHGRSHVQRDWFMRSMTWRVMSY